MDAGYCLACRAEVTPTTGDDDPCPTCATPIRLRGRWRVLGPLARGGSARVFRSQDMAPGEAGREVALKILDLADVEDWKQVELFERQLPLLRRLHHPGIPEVYDAFEHVSGTRTSLVLAQSLHRGPNLRDALAGGLRFDEASARAFLDRMLDILDYLHGFSPPILHRDVKPANILLELPEDGDPRTSLARAQPILIDFDTARGVAIDAAAADGTMVGSAGFVPIEQLAGRPVPASDLYGLGVTVIAALSQRDILGIPVERTAAHVVDRVLPAAPYRQWVFTVPKPLRLVLARDPAWTRWTGALVVRAIAAWQRRVARKRGLPSPRTGAVTFVQRFGGW